MKKKKDFDTSNEINHNKRKYFFNLMVKLIKFVVKIEHNVTKYTII